MNKVKSVKNKSLIDKEYVAILKKTLETESLPMKVADAVLMAVAVVALLGVSVATPNALQLLKPLLKNRKYSSRQVRNALDSLHRQEKVHFIKEKGNVVYVKITKQGNSKLHFFSVSTMKIKVQKKWDGKWRIVLFDIPVQFSKGRNAFRFKLKQLGFVQLQRSVWVFPYPCEEELLLVAHFFQVGKYIEIIIAESILDDQKLRNCFKLS